MKKMQWPGLKILLLIGASLFFLHNAVLGQPMQYRLQQADSLFQRRQYTQSFELYQEMLTRKQYTPAMLLKIAFIKEGLNQTGEVLYYLNLYYLATKDQSALERMEELAVKYNLKGYATSESNGPLVFYNQYRFPISIALASVTFFLFSLAIYFRKRKQPRQVVAIILLVMVTAFGVHINFGNRLTMAIVTQPNTYLMNGPSAGASVVSVITAGHRVKIIGHEDVWVKIKWDDKTAYIRQNSLLPVSL